MVDISKRYTHAFKTSIVGDWDAWIEWRVKHLPFAYSDGSSPVESYNPEFSFFNTRCRIFMFFPIGHRKEFKIVSLDKILYGDSWGIFFVLNRANPKGFEVIEESLRIYNENNKKQPIACVLLGYTLREDNEKRKIPLITDDEINQYTSQISDKYNSYVSYCNLDKLDNFEIPGKLMSELLYIKQILGIQIRNKTDLDQVNYIYEKREDQNYIIELKNFLENTYDENLIILLIDSISRKKIDRDYLNYLLNNKNLSLWSQMFIKLILNGAIELKELKTMLNQTANYFQFQILVDRIKDDTSLKYIFIHNKLAEIRIKAFEKIKKPIKENYLKKIIWSNSDKYLISKVALLIHDQTELRKIIFSDLDWNIKTAALKNLDPSFDPDLLEILNDYGSTDFKVTLVNKLSGDLLLRKIIDEANGDEVKQAALDRLSEFTDKYLMDLILSDGNKFGISFKIKCVYKIRDRENKIKLYNEIENSEIKIEIVNRIEPFQVNLVKDILLKEKDNEERYGVINRVIFNDRFSIADFTDIIKIEDDYNYVRLIILHCKSLKLLNAIRLLLDKKYQPIIKKQILKLEQA